MAIYHLSVKTISRSAGRCATAAAAYRSGCLIGDSRTDEIFDYRRKRGVYSADLVLPSNAPMWASDRAVLWNAAETAETRKNSTVAREFEIALPEELSPDERKRLALDFAREVVDRHGCVADVAIHAPSKSGDNRNHHAHILCSTRRLTSMGFGEKTRELDDQKSREIDRWRERYAELQNFHLHEAGFDCVVDHRSLFRQGIDRLPTIHNGPILTAILRRGGRSYVEQVRANTRLAEADFSVKLEIHSHELNCQITLLSADLQSAITERERIKAKALSDSIQLISKRSEVTLIDGLDCNVVDDDNEESEQVYRP